VHLCREHAIEAGFQLPDLPPVTKILSDLASMQVQVSTGGGQRSSSCTSCGTTFGRFRKTGLLGCPQCYETFRKQLEPVIARSQNGACAHVGRRPDRDAELADHQALRRSILDEIERAVATEQYEQAAKLRDRLESIASGQTT
jgi:protein arginine kinase activator